MCILSVFSHFCSVLGFSTFLVLILVASGKLRKKRRTHTGGCPVVPVAGCSGHSRNQTREPRGDKIRTPLCGSPLPEHFSTKTLVASGFGCQNETHYLISALTIKYVKLGLTPMPKRSSLGPHSFRTAALVLLTLSYFL